MSEAVPKRPGRRPDGPYGFTVDFWHTLAVLTPTDERRLTSARDAVWVRRLVRAGVPESRAFELRRGLARWNEREESAGRAPSLAAQIDRVEAWSGVRLPLAPLRRALDRLVDTARLRAPPNAHRVLRDLRRAGVRLAVVSNVINESPAAIRRAIRRLGYGRIFRALVFSAEYPFSKPDPRIYRVALKALGVAPGRSAHIGDLPLDERGARAAGMAAIRLVPATLGPRRPRSRARPAERAGTKRLVANGWESLTADRVVALLRRG